LIIIITQQDPTIYAQDPLRVVKTTKGKGAAASSPKWVVQKGLQGGGFCHGTDQSPKGIQKALEELWPSEGMGHVQCDSCKGRKVHNNS
jgi:hypothetical protein